MEMTMRFSTVAAAVCLCLLPMTGAFTAAPPAPRADIPGTTTTTTAPGAAAPGAATPATAVPPAAKTAPTPSSAAPPSAAPPSGDAAAKHAKRTACLKDAKTKKLVGADKTAFLKSCIAAQ
jgi:hypothetical protein